MEISLESIAEVEDPYCTFVDSIKNKKTLRKYDRRLDYFLKLIPSLLYLEHLEKLLENTRKETLSKYFVNLVEKDSKITQNIIVAFIKEVRKKVENGTLVLIPFSQLHQTRQKIS